MSDTDPFLTGAARTLLLTTQVPAVCSSVQFAFSIRSYHAHRVNCEVRCRKYRLVAVDCRQIIAVKNRKKHKCGARDLKRRLVTVNRTRAFRKTPFVDGSG